MICNWKKPKHTGVNSFWHTCRPSHTKLQKHLSVKSVWVQLWVFSSLFMGRTWLNSCELANVRCHAALSDGRHMSAEVGRKTQPRSSLDSVTIQWRGKKGCRHVSRPSCVSLSSCQQWAACFSYFPETVLAVQQGQQKKKKKATFHFRVHLVPKICKVLNQEVVLSRLHTEPFIPILGENNHKAISQPAQLIRHRAQGHVCIQPHFPGLTVSGLQTTSRCPQIWQVDLRFSRNP